MKRITVIGTKAQPELLATGKWQRFSTACPVGRHFRKRDSAVDTWCSDLGLIGATAPLADLIDAAQRAEVGARLLPGITVGEG